MQIQVRYFAFFRERLGTNSQRLSLPEGATVGEAIAHLAAEHQAIAVMQGRFRAAVNQEMIYDEHVLRDGDELALIPPVAGGSSPPKRERYAVIVNGPLNLTRTIEAIDERGVGGIVTFIGQVRDFNDGHAVVRLEYEAYKEMAEKVMTRLCEEIELEIPGTRLAVEHRVGVLNIGDSAVLIAAGAPHRAQAFDACRCLIDRLKQDVPIWKMEIAPNGQEWIGMGP